MGKQLILPLCLPPPRRPYPAEAHKPPLYALCDGCRLIRLETAGCDQRTASGLPHIKGHLRRHLDTLLRAASPIATFGGMVQCFARCRATKVKSAEPRSKNQRDVVVKPCKNIRFLLLSLHLGAFCVVLPCVTAKGDTGAIQIQAAAGACGSFVKRWKLFFHCVTITDG